MHFIVGLRIGLANPFATPYEIIGLKIAAFISPVLREMYLLNNRIIGFYPKRDVS